MSTKPPDITADGIRQLLWKCYSLKELNSIKKLDSWGDLNYYFQCRQDECSNTIGSEKFVLKIIKQNDPSNAPSVIEGVADVMKFLHCHGYNCCVPINTTNGSPVLVVSESTLLQQSDVVNGSTSEEGGSTIYSIMVLKYVEGITAHEIATQITTTQQADLFFGIGNYFGSMDKTLQVFNNKAIMEREYLKYDLKHLPHLRSYLPIVANLDKRETLERIINMYESQVIAMIPRLSQGFIHNDGNMKNIIISQENKSSIGGVIDFGDCIHSCHIFELAILIVASFISGNQPFDVRHSVRPLVCGYREAFPLPELDLSLLYYVVLGKFAQRYINGEIACQTNHVKDSYEELLPKAWSLIQYFVGTSKIDFDDLILK